MDSITIIQTEIEELQSQNKINEEEYIKLIKEIQNLYNDVKMIPEINEIRFTRQAMKYYTSLLHFFVFIVCFFLALNIYFTKMDECSGMI